MTFEINTHPRVIAELESIHEFLSRYSADVADRTCAQIKTEIRGLRIFPRRCAIAPESARSSVELRHLIVVKRRALFSIIGQTVHVWRVVHTSQKTLNPADIF